MWFKKCRIYADAGAATPLSQNSRREMLRLLDVYGNAGALHKEAVEAKNELEGARKSIARSVGAHADEIIFTASGTEGNNLAIQGVLRPLLQEHGELHAITCAIEHQSVLEPLRAMEKEGLYLTVLPVDAQGFVDPSALSEAINDQTVFVSVQWVNSEVGTIEPIKEIAKEIREVKRHRIASAGALRGASPSLTPATGNTAPLSPLPLYFHTDASQALLWLKMRVESLGIDIATLDAQKVLGPKGVGALYIKRGTSIDPLMYGGTQEFNLRGGTPNVPLAGAFAVALADAEQGVEARAEKMSAVRDYLWAQIKKRLPEAILNGPDIKTSPCYRVANSLNISIPNLEAETAVIAMDAEGVAISTRSACNIGDEEPSHVIKALGVAPELAGTALRITLLPTATYADARRIAKTLADVEKRYRIVV